MFLDLIPLRRLEYEPPGVCHGFDLGIGEALAATAAFAGEAEAAALPAEAAIGAGAAGVGAAGFGGSTVAAASGGFLSSLPSLSTVGTVLSAGGTLLSAKAGLDQAAYQSDLAKSEAEALKQKSNEDAAAAERVQITQNRRTELAQSRARAVAAASGTDATSGDIVNTEGQIAQQGNYNSLSALYEGQARARSDNYQADIDLFRGQQIANAAPVAAGGTLLRGFSDFADRRARLRYYQLGGFTGAGV